MKKWSAIILGSDENAYACARSFYEINGEKTLLLCSRPLLATDHSNILIRRIVSDLDSPAVFSKVLYETVCELRANSERVLVVPCSDYYTELLVNSGTRIISQIDSPILSPEVYSRFSSKGAFLQLCLQYDVPHPKTEIAFPSVFLSQKKDRSYPVVLKPSNSNHTDYLHSGIKGRKKAYVCKNAEELYTALESFVLDGYVRYVAIQEYIEGEENTSAVINAYCDRNSKVRAIGVARPLLEYKNPRDIGNYVALTSFSDHALCDDAADLLERIGYVGFANFDLKYDQKNGRYVYLELNPRQGRSSYWMKCAGVDLMRCMYEDVVLERPYEGRLYADTPCLWINEPMPVIKREMKKRGIVNKNIASGIQPKSAFGLFSDASIPRAVTLLKRNLSAFSKEL